MSRRGVLSALFERLKEVSPAPEGFHWELAASSPGDGWTRYSIEYVQDSNGAVYWTSYTMNHQEMEAFLRGWLRKP